MHRQNRLSQLGSGLTKAGLAGPHWGHDLRAAAQPCSPVSFHLQKGGLHDSRFAKNTEGPQCNTIVYEAREFDKHRKFVKKNT